VKGEERVQLHDRKVVTEEDECGDVDDVLRPLPKVGQELDSTGAEEPEQVRDYDVPDR